MNTRVLAAEIIPLKGEKNPSRRGIEQLYTVIISLKLIFTQANRKMLIAVSNCLDSRQHAPARI